MGQQIRFCHIIHVMNTIPKKSYAPRLGQTPVFLSEYLSLTVSGIGRKIQDDHSAPCLIWKNSDFFGQNFVSMLLQAQEICYNKQKPEKLNRRSLPWSNRIPSRKAVPNYRL